MRVLLLATLTGVIAVLPWAALIVLVALTGCSSLGTRTGPPTDRCGAECQQWLKR